MKARIGAYQLISAIVMIPLATAALFFITPEAKQDAWLAVLFYIIPGIALELVYIVLWRKYPNDNMITYMPKILGKIIGNIFGIVYVIFFAYEAARVARDFVELILISIIPKASSALILMCIMIISAYYVYLGIEDMFRSTNLFLYIWLIFFMFEWIFLYNTKGTINMNNIMPILHNGVVPVIKNTWKLITYPYGEAMVVAMFYPYVKEKESVLKVSILGIVVIGILLSLNTLMFISVLGVDLASNSLFPFLRTVRLMQIGETFDRVDIFVILIMMVGGVIKISFFMYASMLGFAQITKIKDTKYLAVPFSIVVYIAAMLIAKNYSQHIYIGQIITLEYIYMPLFIILPIIALIVYYIKRFIFGNKDGK